MNNPNTNVISSRPVSNYLGGNDNQGDLSYFESNQTNGNNILQSSQNVFESDLVYFEEYINETVEQYAEPLLNKRASFHNNDPMTELTEVYDQVKDMEDTIHKLQEISLFLLN